MFLDKNDKQMKNIYATINKYKNNKIYQIQIYDQKHSMRKKTRKNE